MSNGSAEWAKVQDTVSRQNQTPINEETAIYRVVKIRWENLITGLDNITDGSATSNSQVRKETYFLI